MSVKKPIIRAWVEALRSGKYKQGRGELKNGRNGGFCCLGVLCDLGSQGSWDGDAYASALGGPAEFYTLPNSVRKYVGLSSAEAKDLWQRNDGLDKYKYDAHSFAEIADHLEKTFLS